MTYQKRKKMTDGMAGAFFTVEAAILYPLVLAVIVLMVYLLFFQYDRCLLDRKGSSSECGEMDTDQVRAG